VGVVVVGGAGVGEALVVDVGVNEGVGGVQARRVPSNVLRTT